MSRIAKKAIVIPKGVAVNINDQKVSVKGPKGELSREINGLLQIVFKDNQLSVAPKKELTKEEQDVLTANRNFSKAIWGTTWVLLRNMVQGVTDGFEKKLLLVGIGFRAQVQGKKLNLSLGFSHPVIYDIPIGITVETPSQTEIIVKGIDKELVGQVAASIRDFRLADSYKGKGIRYADEQIKLKETKKK